MNDVDTHPLEQTVRDIYTKAVAESEVLGIYTSEMGTLGGIIKLRAETMLKTNGFPNNYWGWGVEDRALQNRAELAGLQKLTTILSNDPRVPEFFNVDNNHERVETPNTLSQRTNINYSMWPRMSQDAKQEHVNQSGFNTLTYNILERTQLNDITEKILVDIDSVQ
jgi:hypothetical protein